ncbi:MAG: NAD(P)H-hydrate dehydratase [Clostridiales bacterium]|nr:MAG: NAD(P)H-hydrate dehydratase [Clostridiales bacterium]
MEKIYSKDISSKYIKRKSYSSKFDYPNVLIVSGNYMYTGAAILCSGACINSGAGLVRVATAKKNAIPIKSNYPEVIAFDWYDKVSFDSAIKKADTIAIGPGMVLDGECRYIFSYVMERISKNQNLVVDAGAIKLLSDYFFEIKVKSLTITPHLGELKYLLKSAKPSHDDIVNFQNKTNANLVIKGYKTKIYTKDQIFENTTGSPAMAVAGMGDMLTGMIAAFINQFSDEVSAIKAAVFTHGYISDQLSKTHLTTLPTKCISNISDTMKGLLGDCYE